MKYKITSWRSVHFLNDKSAKDGNHFAYLARRNYVQNNEWVLYLANNGPCLLSLPADTLEDTAIDAAMACLIVAGYS